MYISREAEEYFQKELNSGKVVMVLGARQVGKTTLVKHVLKNKDFVYLNLDIEVDKKRLLAASNFPPEKAIAILDGKKFIVIDEAQRMPETARTVKGWFDSGIASKIILLGSSSLNLLNQSAESLTGRNVKLFLPPLLFKEILRDESWYSTVLDDKETEKHFTSQLQALLMQTLVFGSYPETVTSSEKRAYLTNLVSDYLLKDILQLSLVKSPEPIHNLLSLLAYQIGGEISVNELSTNLGLSRATIERYLDILESTFVIFRLRAYSTNPRKEIAKGQKIYFWDTGVRNAILNEFSENPMRSDIGKLWENWVVAELSKQNLLSGSQKNLYFWRSRRGSEIDLIIKEGEKLRALEIKWRSQRVLRRSFVSNYKTEVEVIDSTKPLIHL